MSFSDLSLLSFALLEKKSEVALLKVATIVTVLAQEHFFVQLNPFPAATPPPKHPEEHIYGLPPQKAKRWRVGSTGSNWAFHSETQGWEPAPPEYPNQRQLHTD